MGDTDLDHAKATAARVADAETEEPPVVARLVIEIRSDGSRTVARGALQDVAVGQEVAIRAEGTTPLALAASLVGALFRAPVLGRVFGRALDRGLGRALKPAPTKRPRS